MSVDSHVSTGGNLAETIGIAVARLRATKASTLGFYLFGLLTVLIWFTPHSHWYIGKFGAWAWLQVYLAPILLIACTMLAMQQLCAASGADMAAQPRRFLVVVLLSMLVPYGVFWAVGRLAHADLINKMLHHAPVEFCRYAFFFAPIGWLSCLYQQRADDMSRLTQLALRRSMLSRDLAQSTLLTVRAQIDPAMVVRLLKRIRSRYRDKDEAAPFLLDHLIGYLRLAMNRMRERSPSLADESAMAQEYFALRMEEAGIQAEMHIDVRPGPSGSRPWPVFLIVRNVFDAAMSGKIGSFVLRIDIQDRQLMARLGSGDEPLPHESLTVLRSGLTSVFSHTDDILHHISESGEHWYVFEIPIECLETDRPDR